MSKIMHGSIVKTDNLHKVCMMRAARHFFEKPSKKLQYIILNVIISYFYVRVEQLCDEFQTDEPSEWNQ